MQEYYRELVSTIVASLSDPKDRELNPLKFQVILLLWMIGILALPELKTSSEIFSQN